MTKVNKNDLIKQTAEETGVSVSTARKIINAFCSNIEKNVLEGNEVSIKGLVHFYNKEHNEKEVHDFGTMTRVKIGKRVLPDTRISRTIIDKYKHD